MVLFGEKVRAPMARAHVQTNQRRRIPPSPIANQRLRTLAALGSTRPSVGPRSSPSSTNEEHVESMEAPMEQETVAAASNDHRSGTVRSTTDVSCKFDSEFAITRRLLLVSGTVLHDVANQYISSAARSSEGSTSSIPSPYSFASNMLSRLVDLRRISTEKECA
jgi:hypothetical protein